MSRLDAPCVIRKLILGPFKSKLNPVGIMSADWVAKQIVNLARRDVRNIIVTVNPLTFILFPIKISELKETVEQGNLLPPKSTWFEPRMNAGIIINTWD